VIAKRNHPLLTPYAERLVSKHSKFKGHPPLARARKKLGPPGAQAHRDKPASLRE
jgi:hypothetical protein